MLPGHFITVLLLGYRHKVKSAPPRSRITVSRVHHLGIHVYPCMLHRARLIIVIMMVELSRFALARMLCDSDLAGVGSILIASSPSVVLYLVQ